MNNSYHSCTRGIKLIDMSTWLEMWNKQENVGS